MKVNKLFLYYQVLVSGCKCQCSVHSIVLHLIDPGIVLMLNCVNKVNNEALSSIALSRQMDGSVQAQFCL